MFSIMSINIFIGIVGSPQNGLARQKFSDWGIFHMQDEKYYFTQSECEMILSPC